VARLRLFGPAAGAAGVRSDDMAASTVEELLSMARARYGDGFAAVAATCRVWVNGVAPAPGASLGPADEVALLPPVSGG
jgi:molybdopterin converting factor small subunit